MEAFIDKNLQPPMDQRELYLVDLYGEEIYQGDTYYVANEDNISEQSLEQYAKDCLKELTLAEKLDFIKELICEEELSKILNEFLLNEMEASGYATTLQLDEFKAE